MMFTELPELLRSLVIIYIVAKLVGELSERLRQPAVLGELLAGIAIGSGGFGLVREHEVIKFLAEIGAIVLLFEIGLRFDIRDLLQVGWQALIVACIGVFVPFVIGYLVMAGLAFDTMEAIFVAATLTATSVGITARVLSELHKLEAMEGRIIIGAAVADDIIGLIILATVSALALTGKVSLFEISKLTLMVIAFLTAAVVIGNLTIPRLLNLVHQLRVRGILIISALTFALFLGWIANSLKLAPIVGAFTAGIILARTERREHIEEQLKPIADVFVPVFFVLIGMNMEIKALFQVHIFNIAALLTIIAFVGKFACGLSPLLGKRINRLAVGIGMIPRGEVGLIFASLGLAHHIFKKDIYSAIIIMVMLTTLATPILLKLAFKRPITSTTTQENEATTR